MVCSVEVVNTRNFTVGEIKRRKLLIFCFKN